jgi:hypothetical protein
MPLQVGMPEISPKIHLRFKLMDGEKPGENPRDFRQEYGIMNANEF